ncbi:dTDP-glucose 4,6-dehydratase [Sulfolobales archaeon HS-7]|nr:dTDP-glucose 4,6-dehydratase [Sulfolobales archaeon HS-7]
MDFPLTLIIGGAGFIGSSFARLIQNPVIYDALTYAGRKENLTDLRHELIVGDVASPILHEVIKSKRPEIVINFAAETHVDRSINRPENFISTNVYGVLNVLEASRKYDFKYIHISTDEVYGEECADEESPLKPSSPYAASKAAGDLFVKSYVRTYGINAVIIRPSNNYGPRQYPEKFIPKAIIRTLLDMEVPVYGSGNQERDWIYVEDTARMIAELALTGKGGDVYNLPGENRTTNLKILDEISSILGRKIKIKFVKDRPGHDRKYCMTTKLKFNKTPLSEGLKKTVEWYIRNRWWWEPLISDEFFIKDEPWT